MVTHFYLHQHVTSQAATLSIYIRIQTDSLMYLYHVFGELIKILKSYPITRLDRSFGLQEPENFETRFSAHDGGKVVSPAHRPPLPRQEISHVLISVRG